jgi:hypothetical protein
MGATGGRANATAFRTSPNAISLKAGSAYLGHFLKGAYHDYEPLGTLSNKLGIPRSGSFLPQMI